MTEFAEATITDPTKPAQTLAPDTEPTGWMSPTGEIRDGAPESVVNLVKNKGWDTVEKIVEGFVGLEQFKGAGEHLVIPETDDVEGWDNVYKQLGRPDTYDKYEFVNETDIKVDDALIDGFKQLAHKEGYSQKQLTSAIKFQLDAAVESEKIFQDQQTERKEENIQSMQGKWKEQYDPTVQRIDAMADKLGVKQFFEEMGIDKEPEIINMLLTLANGDAESMLSSQSQTVETQLSPMQELDELRKSEAFTQKFHPDHKKAMARFMELNQQIANAGQGRAPKS